MAHAKNPITTLLGHFFNMLLGCSLMAYFYGGICMKIGYIRVSTAEQNTIRQEVLLKEFGVDELFIDKASGKNTDRPELKRMLTYVRQGDTVIVESISRFARNTRDLLDLIA